MQKRFGGLLALALGAVLIGDGLSGAFAGTVGFPQQGTCGASLVGAVTIFNCPRGSITVSSSSAAGVTPPAGGWSVTLSSSCLDTTGGKPVSRKKTVQDGTPLVFSNLFAYPDVISKSNQPCTYTLTEVAVADVTASFDPVSPFAMAPFGKGGGYAATVDLTHAAVPPSMSAAPSTTAAPSTSAAPSTTAAPSTSAAVSASGSAAESSAAGSASAAPLAATGPNQPVKASLWFGIALVLLGLFLLFEGRVRRLGTHRN